MSDDTRRRYALPVVALIVAAAAVIASSAHCTGTDMAASSRNEQVPTTIFALTVSDGGVVGSDGGVPPSDGGVPPSDGGVPPSDGGVPPSDGGVPPSDGGVPPSDGGFLLGSCYQQRAALCADLTTSSASLEALLERLCTLEGGAFSYQACSTVNALGFCTVQSASVTMRITVYPPYSPATAQAYCQLVRGGTWTPLP